MQSETNHAKIYAVNRAASSEAARNAPRGYILYNDETGIIAIAKDIKKYIKSAFGADSPQYRQIKDLKFTPPR